MEHWIAIEQAKGVLMEGYGVTPDNAFKILALVSQQRASLTVHQVAVRLLTRLDSLDAGPIGPDVIDTCLWQIAD